MKYNPIQCLKPLRIQSPYGNVLVVGCGKCEACLNRQASSRTNQLRSEAKSHRYSLFVTLTYSDDNVPRMCGTLSPTDTLPTFIGTSPDGEVLSEVPNVDLSLLSKYQEKCKISDYSFPYLDKRALQLFLKRLRKHITLHIPHEKIRMYACGEYGPNSFRPHFHLCLFSDNPALFAPFTSYGVVPAELWQYTRKDGTPAHGEEDSLSLLEYCVYKSWPFGFVDCQIPKGDVCGYVASYLNGRVPLPRILKARSIAPFNVHSRFLGRPFFEKEREKMYESPYVRAILRDYQHDDKIKYYRIWRSYISAFFPKCCRYDRLSSSDRLQFYTYWYRTHEKFPNLNCVQFSSELVNFFIDFGTELLKPFLASDWKECENLFYKKYKSTPYEYIYRNPEKVSKILERIYSRRSFNFLRGSFDFFGRLRSSYHAFFVESFKELFFYVDLYKYSPDTWLSDNVYNSLCTHVYDILLVSKHFYTFCCNGSYGPKYSAVQMLKKIESFYDWVEKEQLRNFYSAQEEIFSQSFGWSTEKIHFYPQDVIISTSQEYESLLNTPLYLNAKSAALIKFSDSVKHKKINDANKIFEYNNKN